MNKTSSILTNNEGAALITAMLLLVLLSFMGFAALRTTNTELNITLNEKRYQQDFYNADNANKNERFKVASSSTNWYEINNPNSYNQNLLPNTPNYDPGSDIQVAGPFPGNFSADNPATWPRENLLGNINDDQYDYAYLVTYMYPDDPPKGYDASKWSSYKFRVNTKRDVGIETGGEKVGPSPGF